MNEARLEYYLEDLLKIPKVHVERQGYNVAPNRNFYSVFPKMFSSRPNDRNYTFQKTEFTNEAIDAIAHLLPKPYSRKEAVKYLRERLPVSGFLYHPSINDSYAALACRLLPLLYEKDFYVTWEDSVAGNYQFMDAYQMLTEGRVPYDSLALADPERFTEIVGYETAQRAYDHCGRLEALVTVTFNEPIDHWHVLP